MSVAPSTSAQPNALQGAGREDFSVRYGVFSPPVSYAWTVTSQRAAAAGLSITRSWAVVWSNNVTLLPVAR